MKCHGCKKKIKWYQQTAVKGEFHRPCWKSFLAGYLEARMKTTGINDTGVEKRFQESTGDG